MKTGYEVQAEQRSSYPDFGEVWQFRDLLWRLGIRDITVRYRQTLVGFGWLFFQPLALLIALAPILSQANQDVSATPYWQVFLTGYIPWQMFAGTVVAAAMSLVNNQSLFTKVYFPRMLLPLGTTFVTLLEFSISATCLIIAVSVLRGLSWPIVFAPLFALWTIILAIGIGAGLSALNVLYRDVSSIIPFVMQVGFLASPVSYDSYLIPSEWRSIYALNPLTTTLQGWRWALLNEHPPTANQVIISAVVSCCVFVAGMWYFRRVENLFAEKV